MDQARLDAIVAAYGADPRRWPEGERAAAQAFVAQSGVDMRVARGLDALLDHAGDLSGPSDLLIARAVRAAPRKRSYAGPAWALAACAVMGLIVGYGAGLNATPSDSEMDLMIATAFGESGWTSEGS